MNAFWRLPILLATLSLAAADDAWPRFRGPNGAGTIPGATPPLRIGPDQGVHWKVAVPESPSSPVVWGDRIFLTTYATNQLETRAYDRSTGTCCGAGSLPPLNWRIITIRMGSPAASTPAVDAELVVSYFGSAGLFCYDHDGRELWRQEMPVARTHGGFGSGVSPILAGDRVILNRDVLDEAPRYSRWIARPARSCGRRPEPTRRRATARRSSGNRRV